MNAFVRAHLRGCARACTFKPIKVRGKVMSKRTAVVAALVTALMVLGVGVSKLCTRDEQPSNRPDTTVVYCVPSGDGWWHCSRSPIDSIPPVPSNGPVI